MTLAWVNHVLRLSPTRSREFPPNEFRVLDRVIETPQLIDPLVTAEPINLDADRPQCLAKAAPSKKRLPIYVGQCDRKHIFDADLNLPEQANDGEFLSQFFHRCRERHPIFKILPDDRIGYLRGRPLGLSRVLFLKFLQPGPGSLGNRVAKVADNLRIDSAELQL